MAAHYLITGQCYRPSISAERIYVGRWCPALRERYHAAACSGLNYARSAEDTIDPCLAKLFEEMSRESYAHAETLLGLLQRSLQSTSRKRPSAARRRDVLISKPPGSIPPAGLTSAGAGPPGALQGGEIGRASCRERV